MKYFRILFSAAALLLAASCIDNDVPYPVVELRIAGVEGSGFTVSGISIANRTVALTLDAYVSKEYGSPKRGRGATPIRRPRNRRPPNGR